MRRGVAGFVALALPIVSVAAMDDGLDRIAGKALFERIWLPAPSSTDAADGLGPLFNGRSCAACHRGAGPAEHVTMPDGGGTIRGAVVRLGDAAGAHDPFYGSEIQTQAIAGLEPEARVGLLVTAGRSRLDLRLNGPPLGDGIKAGPRLAPSLRGRAALETIPLAVVLRLADPDDRNGDGISGRARFVPGPDDRPAVGRFGWKASEPDLGSQIAHAFAIDMGLSSPLRLLPYGDCTAGQGACRAMPTGESASFDGREVSSLMIELIASYLRSLKPPIPPDDPPAADIFNRIGCGGCHVPRLPGPDGSEVTAFTDLLLHDLGPELDDGVGEPGVASAEWRTAPLIDLDPRGGRRRYLHDGRAESVAAAVRWHGGESARSRAGFEALSEVDRARLIAYLERL